MESCWVSIFISLKCLRGGAILRPDSDELIQARKLCYGSRKVDRMRRQPVAAVVTVQLPYKQLELHSHREALCETLLGRPEQMSTLEMMDQQLH